MYTCCSLRELTMSLFSMLCCSRCSKECWESLGAWFVCYLPWNFLQQRSLSSLMDAYATLLMCSCLVVDDEMEQQKRGWYNHGTIFLLFLAGRNATKYTAEPANLRQKNNNNKLLCLARRRRRLYAMHRTIIIIVGMENKTLARARARGLFKARWYDNITKYLSTIYIHSVELLAQMSQGLAPLLRQA